MVRSRSGCLAVHLRADSDHPNPRNAVRDRRADAELRERGRRGPGCEPPGRWWTPRVRAMSFDARLYLVAPTRLAAGELRALVPELVEAGVDAIQLREKEMEAGDLIRACEPILE